MDPVSKNFEIKGKTEQITLSAKVWGAFEDICRKEKLQEANLAARIWEVKGKSNFASVVQLFVFIYNQPKEISESAVFELLKLRHK